MIKKPKKPTKYIENQLLQYAEQQSALVLTNANNINKLLDVVVALSARVEKLEKILEENGLTP